MRLRPSRLFPVLAALAGAVAASSARAQESPFQARACPVPAGVEGYAVWVTGDGVDAAYARALADAVARRWEPPSRRRASFDGLNRLRDRIQPPEPRFPDDWAPAAAHVARVEITLRRTGRPDEARVAASSGDRAFDRSLTGLFREGAPGAPDLPALPAGADSVRVTVGFGGAAPAGAGLVRFARQQSPVEVVPGSLQVTPPRGASGSTAHATVKYDVDPSGALVASSIQFLSSSDREMEQNVRAGLLRARFQPARSDCRAVALSVVQQFGRR
jgi:TonB family protein